MTDATETARRRLPGELPGRQAQRAGGLARIPAGLAGAYGPQPGAGVEVRARPEALLIRRSPAQMAKVYPEPTTHCVLLCRTCVRDAWHEPVLAGSRIFSRRI